MPPVDLIQRVSGLSCNAFRLDGLKIWNLALEGIAPRNYYLGVYQSRQFTEKTWGRYFEILDYIERGLNAHQDLIVLRRSQ
ncbi:MAG: hypothetical protein HYX74_12450 [Acidobacteria bacterium]|nr:hypothetical protein [Acidobacteriota bacterium]